MEPVIRFRPLVFVAALCLIPALTGCPGDPDEEDPCEGVVCDSPPSTHCDGDVVVTYEQTGTCEDGECIYAPTRTPCGEQQYCADGQCHDVVVPDETCEDIEPCDESPADFCDVDVAVTYAAEGTCIEDEVEGPYCDYAEDREACAVDHACEMIGAVPTCVPIDTDLTCDDLEPCVTPPVGYCTNDIATNYAAGGTCVEEVDGPECVYESTDTDCAATETVCVVEAGAAVCVDLCLNVDCPARESFCDGDVRVIFGGATGDCAWETGECVYPVADETREPCSETQVCQMDGNTPICVEVPPVVPCADACVADAECGRAVDLCVVFEPAEGGFCSRLCATVDDCPADYACEEIVSIDGTTASQCVPDIGYCLDAVTCGIAPPPTSVSADGGYCEHPLCAGDPACEFGFNFDFETWVGNVAPGFYVFFNDMYETAANDVVVNNGDFAMQLSVTAANQNRDLRPAVALKNPVVGAVYTFHAWFQFEPAAGSTDWIRTMMWLRDADGSLNRLGETGGSYWSILGDMIGNSIGSSVPEWTETTVATPPVEADRVDLRPMIRVRSRNTTPTLLWTDDWALTLPYSFTMDAENLDPANVVVGAADGRSIGAAINNAGVLYASTQGAGDLQDRFLYVWLGGAGTDLVAVPWNKHADATVAGPAAGGTLLALVQDNSSAYCSWLRYDTTAAEWTVFSTGADDGTCTNTAGTYLAGTIDLAALLASEPHALPTWIAFAVAGYGQNDGESLISGTQVPVSLNGDVIVDPGETIDIHRAMLLAGKVH